METIDYGIQLTLSVFLIVGGYQFYFWCQRRQLVPARELRLAVDDWIPYRPAWVWIYSFLYYPVILYTNLVVESPREFTHLATSYLLLLLLQMTFFLLFPVATPEHWRAADPGGAGRSACSCWCSGSTRARTAFRACTPRWPPSRHCTSIRAWVARCSPSPCSSG